MQLIRTGLMDALVIQPHVFSDERGFFMETYQSRKFSEAGLPTNFVQDNHSCSARGILRGLHYQAQNIQGKLVRAVAGEVFDVAVDLRRTSPTFGLWASVILSNSNKQIFWIPEGFAHGFYVLSEWAEIVYKATDYYSPEFERSIRWDDPFLNIKWPIPAGEQPLLSSKDANGIPFSDADSF